MLAHADRRELNLFRVRRDAHNVPRRTPLRFRLATRKKPESENEKRRKCKQYLFSIENIWKYPYLILSTQRCNRWYSECVLRFSLSTGESLGSDSTQFLRALVACRYVRCDLTWVASAPGAHCSHGVPPFRFFGSHPNHVARKKYQPLPNVSNRRRE